jgi:predicted nucleic acid-binding protein
VSGWLLDTNVISEWRKPRQNPNVAAFISEQPSISLYTSIVCLAEIRKGAEDAISAAESKIISRWLQQTLRPYFGERALGVDEEIVYRALRIVDAGNRKRQSLSIADAWIAATAQAHGLIIVSRNTKDFVRTAVPVLNPWTGERFNGA